MLSEQRKGEIALLYVELKFKEKGVHIGANFKEQVAETAKKIGISFEETMEFIEGLMRAEFEKAFSKE